jgi:hypothetical protein
MECQGMDVPQFQFRGVFLPADALNLLKEGKVNPSEVMLLLIVESLVNSKGEGCFASNAYLGKMLDRKPDSVQRLISGLKSKKLLIAYDYKRRRYLETAWSRVDPRKRILAPQEKNPGPTETTSQCKTINIGGRLRNGRTGKQDMPFFEETKETKNSPLDVEWADRLRKITVEKRKRKVRWKRSSWMNEFRLLRGELDGDTKRIEKALAWYEEKAGEDGAPSIDSAGAFRRHFGWLEDCVKKYPIHKDVHISEKAKGILSRLRMMRWRNGSDDMLPSCVQTSIDAYKAYMKRVYAVRKSLEDSEKQIDVRLEGFIGHFMSIYGDPGHFTEQWYAKVHERTRNWTEWSGQLVTWSPENKAYQALGRECASEYGDSKLWKLLMDKVGTDED